MTVWTRSEPLTICLQLRTYVLSRLSHSFGRSQVESAAAEFCALKMLMLQQLKTEVEQEALRSDVLQVSGPFDLSSKTVQWYS